MEPTLQTGQYLLINKAVYWRFDAQLIEKVITGRESTTPEPIHVFGQPQRGDVIVFRYPKDLSRDFIKRIIALPGENVEIKGGQVYVNEQPMNETYILDRPSYHVEKQIVPADNYFVLGDNRNNSLDSHVWGNVPFENIIGKAWLSYWPVEKWGLIPSSTLLARQAR